MATHIVLIVQAPRVHRISFVYIKNGNAYHVLQGRRTSIEEWGQSLQERRGFARNFLEPTRVVERRSLRHLNLIIIINEQPTRDDATGYARDTT